MDAVETNFLTIVGGVIGFGLVGMVWLKRESDRFDRKWGKDGIPPAPPKADQLR